ncbi:MAG: CinA family nicotinamide mononucleotide deamidase-related protein [Deltaproteobacteria bacterium]|nr:CinA family nicotinamide mononucleotide deamidase-related protein [Deltaproteobacteria bacterium]
MTPVCEIITIGNELLLGQIVDTNASWLGQTLSDAGVAVTYHTTVGDRLKAIVEVMRSSLARADVALCTGGIGPTEDDLTRQAAAEVAGVPLEFRQDLMDEIEALFRRMGFRMPENNRKQAYIPQGSIPIHNPMGTAPGFCLELNGKLLVALPGVPRELKFLTKEAVLPMLKERFALGEKTIRSRILKVTGLGESAVDRQIGDLMDEGANPSVGLLASPGDIRIVIKAVADSPREADALMDSTETEIRGRLGRLIYGTGDDTLEDAVEELLRRRRRTLALLDTVTGGAVSVRLTRIPSTQLKQALILGSPDGARDLLSAPGWTFDSEEISARADAEALARHIAERSGADLGVAVLGLPQAHKRELKVDLALGVWGPEQSRSTYYSIGGDRVTLYERCAIIALDNVRKWLLGVQP